MAKPWMQRIAVLESQMNRPAQAELLNEERGISADDSPKPIFTPSESFTELCWCIPSALQRVDTLMDGSFFRSDPAFT
jgi:hypothetical protein